MRIIAGEQRGRPLRTPSGRTTRPTTDRVRESLMSALVSRRGGFDGAIVLDAFAGSGALGLEALSRGAAKAVFFERDRAAIQAVKANIETLGYDSHQAQLVCRDVLKSPLASRKDRYDLVFLDPPYDMPPDTVFTLLARLEEGGALSADALIVYEHNLASSEAVDRLSAEEGFLLASRRSWKDTVIDIMERERTDDLPTLGQEGVL